MELPFQDNWAYFGISFSDFGHTIQAVAYVNGVKQPIYFEYGHTRPTNASATLNETTFFDNPNQYAICGIQNYNEGNAIVQVISKVRPIHINSSTCLIYSFFLFFSGVFVITCFLQWHFFNISMDPREYMPAN